MILAIVILILFLAAIFWTFINIRFDNLNGQLSEIIELLEKKEGL